MLFFYGMLEMQNPNDRFQFHLRVNAHLWRVLTCTHSTLDQLPWLCLPPSSDGCYSSFPPSYALEGQEILPSNMMGDRLQQNRGKGENVA